jgi:hypothetical protein
MAGVATVTGTATAVRTNGAATGAACVAVVAATSATTTAIARDGGAAATVAACAATRAAPLAPTVERPSPQPLSHCDGRGAFSPRAALPSPNTSPCQPACGERSLLCIRVSVVLPFLRAGKRAGDKGRRLGLGRSIEPRRY